MSSESITSRPPTGNLSCNHFWDSQDISVFSSTALICGMTMVSLSLSLSLSPPHVLQRFIDLSGSLSTHLFSTHLCDRPVSMILSVYVGLSGYLSASYKMHQFFEWSQSLSAHTCCRIHWFVPVSLCRHYVPHFV